MSRLLCSKLSCREKFKLFKIWRSAHQIGKLTSTLDHHKLKEKGKKLCLKWPWSHELWYGTNSQVYVAWQKNGKKATPQSYVQAIPQALTKETHHISSHTNTQKNTNQSNEQKIKVQCHNEMPSNHTQFLFHKINMYVWMVTSRNGQIFFPFPRGKILTQPGTYPYWLKIHKPIPCPTKRTPPHPPTKNPAKTFLF